MDLLLKKLSSHILFIYGQIDFSSLLIWKGKMDYGETYHGAYFPFLTYSCTGNDNSRNTTILLIFLRDNSLE